MKTKTKGQVLDNKKSPKKLHMKAARNKKKTWKQLQHDDVDIFLEHMREDERLGGITTKTDHELFSIDKSSSGPFDVDKYDASRKSAVKYISQIKEKNKDEPLVDLDSLKCFEILKPHSLVPDPIIKRNRVRLPGENKSEAMLKKDKRRLKKKGITKKTSSCNKLQSSVLDPWSMENPKTVLDNEWVPDEVRRHNLRPRLNPKSFHKTSALPAVEYPHPGYSYNPSFLDHQELLKKAVTEVEVNLRKERNLNKAIHPAKSSVSKIEPVNEEEENSGSEADEVDEANTSTTKNGPKARTRQKKRHSHEEKLKQQKIKQQKLKNSQMSEVFRVKAIEKEIKKNESKQKERSNKLREKRDHHEKFGQKDLSKFKYKHLILDPTLSEELSGNLIGISTDKQQSLLLERFNSLQKRNILEPRVKNRMKRKLRFKKYQRSSTKMDWEKTGEWNGIKVV